jgi:hypothetical protein
VNSSGEEVGGQTPLLSLNLHSEPTNAQSEKEHTQIILTVKLRAGGSRRPERGLPNSRCSGWYAAYLVQISTRATVGILTEDFCSSSVLMGKFQNITWNSPWSFHHAVNNPYNILKWTLRQYGWRVCIYRKISRINAVYTATTRLEGCFHTHSLRPLHSERQQLSQIPYVWWRR